ncbi:hypothetical protein BZA70DRAFT_196368 [Myxozyma melibiosi]|uniref:ENTH domain-containing protein n=1 Tax=Myxozyma melibiosi TaxID=54550 RepID=A0ABR1F3Z6_9ASCO
MSKSIIRSIKNVTIGYSVNQVKVRNATSNDPWGPNSTEMEEIAQLTFDLTAFHEIMEMVDRRLNDKGKNWRHVLKALVLLDYLIHSGSENVVVWAKENIYLIRTLREFLYVDEENKDQGANVRAKAKDLTGLLNDDERIRAERSNRSLMHSRINSGRIADEVPERLGRIMPTQQSERLDPYGIGVDARSSAIDASADETQLDPELRQAIAESKLTAAEEESRRRERETIPDEDEDLARALKLSEEEARRKQQQEYYETQRLSGQFHQPQPTSPLKLQSTGDYQSPFQSPFHTGQQQSQQQPQAANNTDLLVDIFGPTPAAASTTSPAPATSTYPQYSQPASQTTFGAVYPQTTGSNFYNSPPTSTAPTFGDQTHSNSPFASSSPFAQPATTSTTSPFAQPATSSTTSPFAQPATSSTSSPFANPASSNAATSSPFAARFSNPVSSSAATSSPFGVSSGTNSPFSQPQQYPQQSSNSPFKNTSSNSPFSTAQPASTSSAFQFQQTPTSPAFKPTTPFNTTQPVQSHTTASVLAAHWTVFAAHQYWLPAPLATVPVFPAHRIQQFFCTFLYRPANGICSCSNLAVTLPSLIVPYRWTAAADVAFCSSACKHDFRHAYTIKQSVCAGLFLWYYWQ